MLSQHEKENWINSNYMTNEMHIILFIFSTFLWKITSNLNMCDCIKWLITTKDIHTKKLHSWCGKYNLLSLSSSCHVHFVIQHGKKDGKITMQRKNVCFPGNDFSFIPFDEYKQKNRAKEPIHAKTIQHHIKKWQQTISTRSIRLTKIMKLKTVRSKSINIYGALDLYI